MFKALGIDFGTEYLRLAATDDGSRISPVSAPQLQQYKTPCSVGFADRWVWGWSALNAPQQAIWDLKERILDESLHLVRGRRLTGADLANQFFKQFRLKLMEAGGDATAHAVAMTVPYSMALGQREQLRQAAENAGFRGAALINDAEAILLGYRVEKRLAHGEKAVVLVFDVGAVRTAVSVLEVRYSGERLTAELLAFDIQAPGLREAQASVLRAAGWPLPDDVPPALHCEGFEGAFRRAAEGDDAVFDVRGRTVTVPAEMVGRAIEEWRDRAEEGLRDALHAAGLQEKDVDLALAAGGGCELRSIRYSIAFLPIVPEPPTGAGFEDIAARGAARYAAICRGNGAGPAFRSAETPAIGFELADGSFHPVLPVNHVKGAPGFRIYTPQDPATDVMLLVPRQGFARRAMCNRALSDQPIEVWVDGNAQLIKVAAVRGDDGKLRIVSSHGDPNEWTLDLK